MVFSNFPWFSQSHSKSHIFVFRLLCSVVKKIFHPKNYSFRSHVNCIKVVRDHFFFLDLTASTWLKPKQIFTRLFKKKTLFNWSWKNCFYTNNDSSWNKQRNVATYRREQQKNFHLLYIPESENQFRIYCQANTTPTDNNKKTISNVSLAENRLTNWNMKLKKK